MSYEFPNVDSRLIKLVEYTQTTDSIDTDEMFKISKNLNNSPTSQTPTINYLLNKMMSAPTKGLIIIQLLQMLNSMSDSDWVLREFGSSTFLKNVFDVLKSESSDCFKEAFLTFFQEIAVEHENSSKYRNIYDNYLKIKSQYNFPKKQSTQSSLDKAMDPTIKKAIDLSLQQLQKDNKQVQSSQPPKLKLQAKVLYDFTAEESGELTIKAGEIITVIEQPNTSWWKGQKGSISGYFPANFVTLSTSTTVPTIIQPQKDTVIDDAVIDFCYKRLMTANQVCPQTDENELLTLENSCRLMREEAQKSANFCLENEKKFEELDKQFNESIRSYQKLMEDSRINQSSYYSQPINQTNPPIMAPPLYPPPNIPQFPYQYQNYPSQPYSNVPQNMNYQQQPNTTNQSNQPNYYPRYPF